MNSEAKYKVGDKVETRMGVGVIEFAYESGGRIAYSVNHGKRNPGCPTWEHDIKRIAAKDREVYSR